MPRVQVAVEGYRPANGEEDPIVSLRIVGPHFFETLGVPLLQGREFTDDDGVNDSVAIVNQTFAERVFPHGEAINRTLTWTGSLAKLLGHDAPNRIVGVVADIDDEHLVKAATPIVYQPVKRMGFAGRLFVRATGDPYALVPAVTRTIRAIAPDQPIERPATLEDVRTEVLSSNRLNAFVFSTFAGMALLIAVVGVAGVLAFSVSARTREFGIRLAVGSAPRHILARVLAEGGAIALLGIAAGVAAGYALSRAAQAMFGPTPLPGTAPTIAAAVLLAGAAMVASVVPAARASKVDVLQALRAE